MEKAVEKFEPQHTLDYFVEARSENKRNYIFDYGKSRTCDHPEMKIIARGGNLYRCTECNYAFQWPGAIQWPLHFTVIQGIQSAVAFAKEFGMEAVQEVLRRPIGTYDGSPHKPVLPEGMSLMDTLALMDGVDVTVEDGGKAQLEAIHKLFFVNPENKAEQLRLQEKLKRKGLEAANGRSGEAQGQGTLTEGGDSSLPSLP